MYTNCPISNFHRVSFSAFFFEICMIIFFCIRISLSSFMGQYSRHIIFQSLLFPYLFNLSPSFFLFQVFRLHSACISFSRYFPILPEARHTGAIFEIGLGTHRYLLRLPPFLLFPVAANFLYCQPRRHSSWHRHKSESI